MKSAQHSVGHFLERFTKELPREIVMLLFDVVPATQGAYPKTQDRLAQLQIPRSFLM